MEIAIFVVIGGVVSMIVGSIWYGPLFGKKWMEICGVTEMDIEKRKQMQKEAMPLYIIQFLLTLVQFYMFILVATESSNLPDTIGVNYPEYHQNYYQYYDFLYAFIIWIGFVMPTIAGSAMWNNDPSKVKWARFLIQSGYQLVMFLIFGFMTQMWL